MAIRALISLLLVIGTALVVTFALMREPRKADLLRVSASGPLEALAASVSMTVVALDGTAVELRIPTSPPVVADGTAATDLVYWWQRHDSSAIETLQDLLAVVASEGGHIEAYIAQDGQTIVSLRRSTGLHDIIGWAEFDHLGHLLSCDPAATAPTPNAAPLDDDTAATLALACWRMSRIDPQDLIMLQLHVDKTVPIDGWVRTCGNWSLVARTTEFRQVSANGSSVGGSTFDISLGEDGVLRNYSVGAWRACGGRVIRCGTRSSTADSEPPAPVANN